MERHSEITFAGVGGQGLMSAGNILCLAAVTYAGLNATMASEYGTETRGTFAKSDVIVSDEPIYYPEIEESSIVLCLSPIAFARYKNQKNDKMTIIYDSDVIEAEKDAVYTQIGVPFTSVSRENGNLPVNMISLGYIVAMTKCVEAENVTDALNENYKDKEKSRVRNVNAFKLGYELAGR